MQHQVPTAIFVPNTELIPLLPFYPFNRRDDRRQVRTHFNQPPRSPLLLGIPG